MPVDRARFHLQVVTPRISPAADVAEVLLGVLGAGADSVLLRDTDAAVGDVTALIRAVERQSPGVAGRLIIHDRSGAGSIAPGHWRHIPESPMVRDTLDSRQSGHAFGVSVHSLAVAREAVAAGARYVVFGHVFETGSHPGAPPRGVDALAAVVAKLAIPVLGIGGISGQNVDAVLATGCAGVAVISAVFGHPDPVGATHCLRARLDASPHRPRVALSLDVPALPEETP